MAELAYRYPTAKIIVFAKEPIQGQVKTRLAESIGDAAALRVHEQMVETTVKMVSGSGLAELELFVSGYPGHPLFKSLADEYGIQVCSQHGNDLGERMFHALEQSLDTARYCILIGCDCPVMTPGYIELALCDLEQGRDVVIGPAEDGGYVLFGATRAELSWFKNIDWGSHRVLDQSRQRLRASNASYDELLQLWDVDQVEDLHRWRLCSCVNATI